MQAVLAGPSDKQAWTVAARSGGPQEEIVTLWDLNTCAAKISFGPILKAGMSGSTVVTLLTEHQLSLWKPTGEEAGRITFASSVVDVSTPASGDVVAAKPEGLGERLRVRPNKGAFGAVG